MSFPDVNFDGSSLIWMNKREGVKEKGTWKALFSKQNELMEDEWKWRIRFLIAIIFFALFAAILCAHNHVSFLSVSFGFILSLLPVVLFCCVNSEKYLVSLSAFAVLGSLLFWSTYLIISLSHLISKIE